MTKRMAMAALALIGVFISLYLTLYKMGAIGELACTVGSCETVNTSRWATFLGLPVAAWGMFFYVALLMVTLVGTAQRWVDSRPLSFLLVAMTGWGVLFSGWLTWLELFVIHAICIWCVTSAVLVVILFAISVLDLRDFAGTPEAESQAA